MREHDPNANFSRSIDLLLGDPIQGALQGETMRPVAPDHEIAAKVIAQADDDANQAGRDLYDVWTSLPKEVDVWRAQGLPSHVREPRRDMTFAVFGAAGVNADLAVSFCTELEGSAALQALPDDIARTCVVRSWNVRDSDPTAGTIIAKTLAAKLTPDSLAAIFSQRYWTIQHHAGKDSVTAFANYGTMLEGLATEGYLSQDLTEVAQAQYDKVKNDIAEAVELRRRSEIIDQANGLIEPDIDNDTYIRLIAKGGILEKVQEFDPNLAFSLELRTNSCLLANVNVSNLQPDVLQRQNSLLELVVATSEQQPDAEWPKDLRAAVRQELQRRIDEIALSSDDRFVAIKALASQLNMEEMLQRVDNKHEDLVYKEDRERDRRATLRELDFDMYELPSQIESLEVYMPKAHLQYNSIEDIIADIEQYFVTEKTTGETHRDVTKIVGSAVTASMLTSAFGRNETALIFNSMRDELREWAADKSEKGEFRHSHDDGDGTPYKYSGSPFSGNRIYVHKVEDGKYLLGITSGGYGYDFRNPSYNLLAFADALDKSEEVDYDGIPTIELEIAPSNETIHQFANIPEAEFEHPGNVNYSIHRSVVSASLPNLVTHYQRVLGIPETGNSLASLSAAIVNDANEKIANRFRTTISLSLDSTNEIMVGYVGDRTKLHEDGRVDLNIATFKYPDTYQRQLSPATLRLGLTTTEPLDRAMRQEMVRRAQLYSQHIGQHELPEGWSRLSGGVLAVSSQ